MKTAISLPDDLYRAAENTAKIMGIPRSQLFAKALQEFIKHHENDKITEKLNQVYNFQKNDENIERPSLESIRNLTKNDSW